jgi:hypothetical protein
VAGGAGTRNAKSKKNRNTQKQVSFKNEKQLHEEEEAIQAPPQQIVSHKATRGGS